ncbi:drug/metabolite transporter (DMT)-like permease [Anoxybacillus tengchongensis]|uniref:Drug/metabolite transporter (DMT)-like permease n=1 Tax=Anoxybacillus tengchongensis TaxID=576944 RepID=A0A7W9YSB3_9BACL|nr:DMT family transporter [Anoxybacillus tengchongensis]MBB6176761.1 drug/metabolite transporter (DMT)-like permease [Anoxybacillus tengchongensis]
MWKGYGLVLLSATGFAFIPIFALHAYNSGVNVTTLLFLRFALAALFFFMYVWFTKKNAKVSWSQLFYLFLLGGIFYMMQSSFYFHAVKYIPSSLAALLLYLNPIFVAIFSFFINQEKLTKRTMVAMAISFSGMLLVLGAPEGKIQPLGIALAIGAAVIYSIYIIVGNKVTAHVPPMTASAYIALFAAFSFFVWGISVGTLHFQFDAKGWISVIGTSFVSSVLAILAFFSGMNMIGPTKAAILSMLEPVITFLLSMVFLQERMSFMQMIGGLIVLSGAMLVAMGKEQQDKKKTISISA